MKKCGKENGRGKGESRNLPGDGMEAKIQNHPKTSKRKCMPGTKLAKVNFQYMSNETHSERSML